MAFPKRQLDPQLATPFRVWRPEEGADVGAAIAAPPVPGGGGPLTCDSRLSEVNERFFLPDVLGIGEGDALSKTAVSYNESIAWWVQLMLDPPIRAIVDGDLRKFEARLHKATWRRGLKGRERMLEAFTIAKHLRQVCTVLRHCGPRLDRRRPYAQLLADPPYLTFPQPEHTAENGFELDAVRAIIAACKGMTRYGLGGRDFVRHATPADIAEANALMGEEPPLRLRRCGDGGEGADEFWRVFCATAFYTGFRSETLLGLEWSMIEERFPGRFFFNAPARIMKGKKIGEIRFIRPELYARLMRRPRTSKHVLDWRFGETHLRDRHKYLQSLAGLDEPRKIHTWRATYDEQIATVGLDEAIERAQAALRHKSKTTTNKHYVDFALKIEPLFILKMPAILPADDDQGRLF